MGLWNILAVTGVAALGAVLFFSLVADEIARTERELDRTAHARSASRVAADEPDRASPDAELETVPVDASDAAF